MAFFGKKFIKVTEKWVPVVKSVSNYNAKRLAKDIEKHRKSDRCNGGGFVG